MSIVLIYLRRAGYIRLKVAKPSRALDPEDMYIAKNMRKLSIQFIQLHNFRIQLLYVSKHFFVFNHIYILCTAVTGYLIFLLCFSGHLSLRS